jgi:hypothetical protein
MAFRTWARILLATLGVAALAGAGQLGVAYGLGIVRLTRVFDAVGRDQWHAQLTWVAWFAMVAAVVAGLAGGRFHQRWASVVEAGTDDAEPASPAPAPAAGLWVHVAIAVTAGLGATAVVPLTMQPARTAMIDAVDAALVIGICAGLGALVGIFATYAALAHVVARRSFAVVCGTIWLIAVVSVAPSLGPDDPLPAVRLGVFDAGFLSPATTQRFALVTMPALALLIGAVLGWAARRREFPPVTIALAGLPGPALVTAAYLIAGPGDGGQRYQVVPYWAAMVAAGAGVLGAVIAALIRRGTDEELDGAADQPAGTDPDPGLPPLPRRQTGQPDSPAGPGADTVNEAGATDAAAPPPLPAAPPPLPIGAPVPRPHDTGTFAGSPFGSRPRDDRAADRGAAGADRATDQAADRDADQRPGPFPPVMAHPHDSDAYLDPADFAPAGPTSARARGGAGPRGPQGFLRPGKAAAAFDGRPAGPGVRPTAAAPGGRPTAAAPGGRPTGAGPGGRPTVLDPGARTAPPLPGGQPHQVGPPLARPTPLTPPPAAPRAQNAPHAPHPLQAQGAPHPAALPHLVAPHYPSVPPPPSAPAPRGGFGPQAGSPLPPGTGDPRRNASPGSSSDGMTPDLPGNRATSREDQPGRRSAADQPGKRGAADQPGKRGADGPVGKKDEDFVDWVSGLGND